MKDSEWKELEGLLESYGRDLWVARGAEELSAERERVARLVRAAVSRTCVDGEKALGLLKSRRNLSPGGLSELELLAGPRPRPAVESE